MPEETKPLGRPILFNSYQRLEVKQITTASDVTTVELYSISTSLLPKFVKMIKALFNSVDTFTQEYKNEFYTKFTVFQKLLAHPFTNNGTLVPLTDTKELLLDLYKFFSQHQHLLTWSPLAAYFRMETFLFQELNPNIKLVGYAIELKENGSVYWSEQVFGSKRQVEEFLSYIMPIERGYID
jgi:hypothetical protein